MRRKISWLVLFLILVVVVTVLVPAVAKVRDQANRVQCQNNLRSTGLAVRNYYATFNYLPPATMANAMLTPEKRFGWPFLLLPFQESENLTARCDKDKSWNAEENQFAARMPIAFYQCQANPDYRSSSPFGASHYLGIAGVGKDADMLPKDDPKAGIFGYDRKITFYDIKDGTYLTVMVVETALPHGAWTAGGPDTVRGVDPEDSPYMGPNGPFGGNHSGGTNVLFADGSVHFLRTPFDPPTFEALATYNGSETISKDKFKVEMPD
jgi:prepilin-type processing-associated H-X9-DG protein